MNQSIPAAPTPPPPLPKVTVGHLPTNPHFENEGKYKTFLVLMSSFAWEQKKHFHYNDFAQSWPRFEIAV